MTKKNIEAKKAALEAWHVYDEDCLCPGVHLMSDRQIEEEHERIKSIAKAR